MRKMDFDEFWRRLQACLKPGKKLRILRQRKVFDAVTMDPETVTVTPESTKKQRVVKKDEFKQMWDMMKHDIRGGRYISWHGQYLRFWNPVYVSALIDYKVRSQDMQ